MIARYMARRRLAGAEEAGTGRARSTGEKRRGQRYRTRSWACGAYSVPGVRGLVRDYFRIPFFRSHSWKRVTDSGASCRPEYVVPRHVFGMERGARDDVTTGQKSATTDATAAIVARNGETLLSIIAMMAAINATKIDADSS